MDDLAALMARGRDHDGNIQPGVAGEEGAGEGSLQQNVVFAALAAGQHLAADALGDGVHLPAAGLLFALMDLVGEVVGGGAAAAGVGEDVDFQEADLLQELAALPEIFLRLAGEAADAVGGEADRAVTVGGAELADHLGVLLGGIDAAHPAQGGAATALQAQVVLGAELVHCRQPGDVFGSQHIGVKAAQPDTLDALHPGALLHQLHEVGAGVEAVAGQGDGAEHHFPVAGSGQLAQLGEDALFRAAAHRAAGAGDDAVGALAVAAVLYFDKGAGVGLEPLHWQFLEPLALRVGGDGDDALVAVQQLEHIIEDGFPVAVATDQVGLHELGRFLGESLWVAAGEDGDGAGVLALGPAEPLAALLVAEVGDGAAVHHKDVGLFALRHDGETGGAEHLFQRTGLI